MLSAEIERCTKEIARLRILATAPPRFRGDFVGGGTLLPLRSRLAANELALRRDRLGVLNARLAELQRASSGSPRKRLVALVLASYAAIVVVSLVAVAAVVVHVAGAPGVQPFTVLLAPTIDRSVSQEGERFFAHLSTVSYTGGTVTLSGSPPPAGDFWVDDRMVVTVRHPDGSGLWLDQSFNLGCETDETIDPVDITWMFVPGENRVSIELYDACGDHVGTSGPLLLSIR